MFEKLKIKVIYDDFLAKVSLNEEQKELLDLLIKKETIVKISQTMNMSERTVSYEIKKLKGLYKDYKQLEIMKLLTLTS